MKNVDRYLKIVRWAQDRYRDENGFLPLRKGGAPLAYLRIEAAAFARYMEERA